MFQRKLILTYLLNQLSSEGVLVWILLICLKNRNLNQMLILIKALHPSHLYSWGQQKLTVIGGPEKLLASAKAVGL